MFALAAGLGASEERVPAGLDAIVGEGGKGLSVGESQRLQLARVIIANPRLLILDEARANLDFATELGQADACQTETGTHLSLWRIATRWAKDADWILVLDRGRLAGSGKRSDLIHSGGWFATLSQGAPQEPPA
jgi:ABC-type multidrug transport system fused ATPase/permease subunit